MDSLATHRSGGLRRGGFALVLAAIVAAVTMATAAPASASSSVRESTPSGTVSVSGLNEVAAVSAGGGCPDPAFSCPDFALALLSNDTVMAWGNNEAGQLGNGTFNSSATPVTVTELSGATAIAAGWSHSLALLSDGTVKAWGSGGDGALGQGSFTSSDVPVAVTGLSGVTAVSAGADHSLALLSDGTVMGWGKNEFGDLGGGAPVKTDVPVAVTGLSGVIAISAGRFFNLALLTNGKVMGWGYDGNGELGNFTGPCETWPGCSTPVGLGELSGVTAISAGLAHSLALLGDGTVRAWGFNQEGQLGNGTFTSSTAAVTVSGLSGVTAIAAGSHASFALLNDGSAWVWGYRSDLPSALSGFRGATGISAGGYQGLAYGPFATVTSVTPSAGPTAGGTSVNITGTGLSGATSVKFGATEATSFTVNSDTSITAVSPAESAGTVDVTVTTPVDTSLAASTDRFSYVPPPIVGKVSPTNGSAGGGTTVTIKGKNLTGATAVKFGSTNATSFTVNSGTLITAVSPAEMEGKVDVTVTTPYGTSAISAGDHFTFTPTVTNVSPNAGPTAGGTSVTITGTGFALGTTATIIKFGLKRATSVNCTSTTTCTAVTEAHEAGTVDVHATVNKVASPTNRPADQFTYS
jgi:alpha-tubulin suppressor-like RCC1 family protein